MLVRRDVLRLGRIITHAPKVIATSPSYTMSDDAASTAAVMAAAAAAVTHFQSMTNNFLLDDDDDDDGLGGGGDDGVGDWWMDEEEDGDKPKVTRRSYPRPEYMESERGPWLTAPRELAAAGDGIDPACREAVNFVENCSSRSAPS